MRRWCLLAAATSAACPVLGQPRILTFSPASGAVGTQVTIVGTNFSNGLTSNMIRFGSVRAPVSSATLTSLVVMVPAGAGYAPITVTTGGRTAYSPRPFAPTFDGRTGIDASSFSNAGSFAVGVSPAAVLLVDLNADGKLDVLTVNSATNSISLLRNQVAGASISFAPKVDLIVGTHPSSVAAGDFDADGALDLAIANRDSPNPSIAILRNNSAGDSLSFSLAASVNAGTYPQSVVVADFDLDGLPDIAVVNNGSANVQVHRNTSIGSTISFASPVILSVPTFGMGVEAADWDGDGRPDLASVHVAQAAATVQRNLSVAGVLSFANPTNLAVGAGPNSMASGDLDGDARLDLVVGSDTARSVSVLRNAGTPGVVAFAPAVAFPSSDAPRSLALGNLDGDTRPDLLMIKAALAPLSLWQNTGTNQQVSFAAGVDLSSGTGSSACAIGDLDGDGKPDIVVANNDLGGSVRIFQNTIQSPLRILSQPQSQTVPWGTTVSFTVVADGPGPLFYQWFIGLPPASEENVLEESTNATLVLSNVVSFDSGNYFVVVSNALESVSSEVAVLTVKGFIQSQVDAAAPGATVEIPAGTYVENVVITNNLHLRGAGPKDTIVDGGGTGLVFDVSSGDQGASISDLTIRNGYGDLGSGLQVSGVMTISNCTIIDNESGFVGGGVINFGTLILIDSTVAGNRTLGGLGGGVVNLGTLVAVGDTFSDNVVANGGLTPPQLHWGGGGIYNGSGVASLTNCTLSGNLVIGSPGGGVFNASNAVCELVNCTVTLNSAQAQESAFGLGGGVYNECAGVVRAKNTVFAGNTGSSGAGQDFAGSIVSLGNNLIRDGLFQLPGCADAATLLPTDIRGQAVNLGPLQDNGGLTYTHALLRMNGANPAIDAGSAANLPATDQRGSPRISDGDGDAAPVPDIGGFEYQNTPPLTTAFFTVDGTEDTASAPVQFAVWDQETPASNLTVRVSSSDTNLVPIGNLFFGRTDANCSLVLVPATNQNGSLTVTVTVSDGLLIVTNSFLFNVTAVNDPPTISAFPDLIVGQNRSITIPFQIGDIETPPAGLTLQAVSSDSALVPPAGLVFGGGVANRTLTVAPALNRAGTNAITCTVTDPESASASASFQLIVQAPPVFTNQPLSLTTTNCAAVTLLAGVIGDDVSYQWLFNGGILAAETNVFLTLPCLNTNQVGLYALVAINYGGSVTSTPALLRVTTLPFISYLSDAVTVSGLPVGPINFTVWDAETLASNLIVTVTSSDPAVVPPSGLVLGGSGTNRTLTVTPATNATGGAIVAGATIVVQVVDSDSGTSAKGFRLTVGRPLAFTEQPPTSLTVTQGNVAAFNAAALGYGNLTYQWRFNGANLTGATNSTLQFDFAQPAQSGDYTVVVTHEHGTLESSNANLTVIVPPSIISAQSQVIPLYAGWNLIAFQVGIAGFTVPEIQASLDRTNALLEVWGYEAANRAWRPWQLANSNVPPDIKLDKLWPGHGYWVRMSQGAVLTLRGAPWTGTNALQRGWNLVGFPGATVGSKSASLSLDSIFGENLTRLPQMWTFNGLGQRFVGWDSAARPAITELNVIDPGRGYWVYSLDGYVMSPTPIIALPGDSDISPLQTPELFNRFDPRFTGTNPDWYENRMVSYAGPEDIEAGADLNGNGILDDPVTQDTLLFKEGVRVQTISIANAGDGLLNWAVDSKIPWLSVDAASGVVGAESAAVNVSVDRAGRLPGTYANSIFVVQAGSLVKQIRVILKVPDISGDYRGAATTARVNGKPISLGKVNLNLTMFGDSGEIGGPSFRAAIDREKSLLFPRDVFMNGIFYQANDFSLTTGFEMPPADRNVPPYDSFNHTTGLGHDYDDKDWNGNGKLDNENPFPFSIRREITLLGKRKTPDHLEGTYIESVQGMLPESQRIYIEGTFALDRETLVPTRKSIYNGKSTNNPVQIGGTSRTSYTNSLVVSNAVVVEGVKVVSKVKYGKPAELEIFLITPDGRQVWLHRFGPTLAEVTSFEIPSLRGAIPAGTWRFVVRWSSSTERGDFNGWELLLEGLVVYTLGGTVAMVEKGVTNAAADASVILSGSNLLPQSRTSTNGTFLFLGLTENDYFLNISKLGYYDTNIFVRITNSSVNLGTMILRPITNTEPFLIAAPFAGYAPLYVNFKLVVPPAFVQQLGGAVTATWDFGDGTGGLVNQAVSATVTHTYTEPGVFRPRATLMGGGTSREFTVGDLIVQSSRPNAGVGGNYFVFGGGFVGSIASPMDKNNVIEVEPTARGGIVYQQLKRDPAAFDVDRFPLIPAGTNAPFNFSREDTDFFVQPGTDYAGIPQTIYDVPDSLYKIYPQPTYGGNPVPDRFRISCTMGGYIFTPETVPVWTEGSARVGDFILQVGRVEP